MKNTALFWGISLFAIGFLIGAKSCSTDCKIKEKIVEVKIHDTSYITSSPIKVVEKVSVPKNIPIYIPKYIHDTIQKKGKTEYVVVDSTKEYKGYRSIDTLDLYPLKGKIALNQYGNCEGVDSTNFSVMGTIDTFFKERTITNTIEKTIQAKQNLFSIYAGVSSDFTPYQVNNIVPNLTLGIRKHQVSYGYNFFQGEHRVGYSKKIK